MGYGGRVGIGVGYEADCVWERAVLVGGCRVEDGEAVGGVEKRVEVMGGRSEGVAGGDSGKRGVDLKDDFIGQKGEFHG